MENINVRILTMDYIFNHKFMILNAVENSKDFNSLELDKYKEKYGVYIHYQNDKFLICNLVFAFTAVKLAPYVIINGILLIIYTIGMYGIIKTKQ